MQHHGISQRANLILSVRNQASFFRKKDLFVKPCNPEKRSWIYSQVCALKKLYLHFGSFFKKKIINVGNKIQEKIWLISFQI